MEDLENKIIKNNKLLKFIKKKLKINDLSKFKKDKIESFVDENLDELIKIEKKIKDKDSAIKFISSLRNKYLKEYKKLDKFKKRTDDEGNVVFENPLVAPPKKKSPKKKSPKKPVIELDDIGNPLKDSDEGLKSPKTPKEKPSFFEGDDPRDEGIDDLIKKADKELSDEGVQRLNPGSPDDDPDDDPDDEGIDDLIQKVDKQLSEEGIPKYAPDSPDYDAEKDKEAEPRSPVYHKNSLDNSSSDEEPGDELPDEIVSEKDIDFYTISQHRKAYVKWVNQFLYKKVKDLHKDSPLRIYQLLVQKYLAIDTPYRGLLVYHGLGTGKTATAISLAEGLSNTMKINTILPASLEMEFIKEVQEWGKNELNKDNLWKFYPIEDIKDDLKKEIKENYNLSDLSISKIISKVKKSLKNEIIKKNSDKPEDDIKNIIKDMGSEIKNRKGIYLPDKKGKKIDEYDDIDQEFILQQINYLIELKYNFIHYNPFPNFEKTSLEEFLGGEDDDYNDFLLEDQQNIKSKNKKIVKTIDSKLKENQKKYNINSPFYKEVVIIDEVHNFIRQIANGNKKGLLFYNWIINAKDIKLIFLSGTPVINKPSEIAILYNMLKGLIKIYQISIKTKKNVDEITEKLNKIYYKDKSSIELFHVEQNSGKIIISYIQEREGFESLLDDELDIVYTLKTNDKNFNDFINEIYYGLHELFDEESITPTLDQLNSLSDKEKKKIQRGDPKYFDKDIDLLFNKEQKLFDIREDKTNNNDLIDMTNVDNFVSYFFENGDIIPHQKRILLKRMLMGLTSYYPIDRSSIVDMPQIKKPFIIDDILKNSPITKSINLVRCPMSQMQFEKYSEMWSKEKEFDDLRKRRSIFNDSEDVWHYNTRTRQACNIVYENDDFKSMKKTETNKKEIEDLKQKEYSKILSNESLKLDNNLQYLSPKFYQIMNNIKKFISPEGNSTGKILFYSDFRSDSGSEAFELVLKSNGYEKLDTKNPQTTKGLRYTFITGSEGQDERRISRDYFNDKNNKEKINKFGEYCQIMIISSAGAEGISLTCVRQVHILEPYWNYVRVDQVFGRAIRMKSHLDLDEDQRDVEQYLYLSSLPEGTTYDSIYKNLKDNDTWELPDCDEKNIIQELSKSSNNDTKSLFDAIITINNDSQSTDLYLFDVMQKKYNMSLEINSVIKESSLDCIQHTRDDPELNDKCIRFSDRLINEISYFPGIGCKLLELIDTNQLEANYIFHIKPNIYVIYGFDEDQQKIYLYYQYDKEIDEKIDIRYIRDNGKKLAEIYEKENLVFKYVSKDHPYNETLTAKFSVYQEMYSLKEELDLEDFPSLDKLTIQDNLEGYKLKYNVNDTYFFIAKDSIINDNSITKIYPYKNFIQENYTHIFMKPIIIYNGKLYIED